MKTLAAMILTPCHNLYRMYRNGDKILLASGFNIEQTKTKKKNITTIEKAPKPPVDPEKIINELTRTKWEAVAKERKV